VPAVVNKPEGTEANFFNQSSANSNKAKTLLVEHLNQAIKDLQIRKSNAFSQDVRK
jgi:hypothetical protein